jgi:transposase
MSLKKTLEPLMQEAKEGTKQVYFVDAAHFVLGPFLGFLWSFSRVFIKAPSGRSRFNVLGALHATSHELVSVENDSYINALSVCELLEKLRDKHKDESITLILDNARYQKCKIVWAKAESLNITLQYLPSYSPNLNLIERLWKFVKKTCLYSVYYENFGDFKSAIKSCLDDTHRKYKAELDTLLAPNFQTFTESKNVAL